MQAEEGRLPPRESSGAGKPALRLAEAEGSALASAIAAGHPEAIGQTAEIAAAGGDVDPLYRWIGETTVPPLEAGDPRPILAVNAARWGAHLLGSRGAGPLTARLIERLHDFARGGS
jgi:hypothetical protein